MKKYLKIKERIIDMETLVSFEKDRLYEVIYESDDIYMVTCHCNVQFGIDKKSEGTVYDVVEKE